MRIALDVFGGDYAPAATLHGAINAQKRAEREGIGLQVVLVGDSRQIKKHLPSDYPAGIELLNHSSAGRRKGAHSSGSPEPAIRFAARLHREGEVDAIVSAGSTSAQVMASLVELDIVPGVTRPAIGALLPTASGRTLLLDVGASLVASPHHLVQFAAMGQVYVELLLGVQNPRIGLLNVGGESMVGAPSVRQAHGLLAESGFNYIGFVEGRDIPLGHCDIVVTNGFTGNVLLKYTEGLPALLPRLFPNLPAGGIHLLDFHAAGGEPLLGVQGVSIICHGASSERAVEAAIFQSIKIAQLKLHEKIGEFLSGKFPAYISQINHSRPLKRSIASI